MQEQASKQSGTSPTGEAQPPLLTCPDCPHAPVCIIYRNFKTFIEGNFKPSERPIDPEGLRGICKEGQALSVDVSVAEETTEDALHIAEGLRQ